MKFPVQFFASLARVYISSSSPQSESALPPAAGVLQGGFLDQHARGPSEKIPLISPHPRPPLTISFDTPAWHVRRGCMPPWSAPRHRRRRAAGRHVLPAREKQRHPWQLPAARLAGGARRRPSATTCFPRVQLRPRRVLMMPRSRLNLRPGRQCRPQRTSATSQQCTPPPMILIHLPSKFRCRRSSSPRKTRPRLRLWCRGWHGAPTQTRVRTWIPLCWLHWRACKFRASSSSVKSRARATSSELPGSSVAVSISLRSTLPKGLCSPRLLGIFWWASTSRPLKRFSTQLSTPREPLATVREGCRSPSWPLATLIRPSSAAVRSGLCSFEDAKRWRWFRTHILFCAVQPWRTRCYCGTSTSIGVHAVHIRITAVLPPALAVHIREPSIKPSAQRKHDGRGLPLHFDPSRR